MVEVALGADKTAAIESNEFIERMEKGDKIMGTSCCPAYVEAVKKHSTDFLPFVSHAKTPMAYTAEIINENLSDTIKVFIGPCVAKKHEGLNNPLIDYVLTFEELESLFIAKNINLTMIKETKLDLDEATKIGRSFPVNTGVANALKETLKEKNINVKPVFINGFNKQNVKLLNIYAKGNCDGNLIEVMSCEGGCIAGPCVLNKPQDSIKKLNEFLK
ncbi:MAG: hypothetical protein A2086_13845 [Spirochaetes bacterium GWD1_27_9]|nr:MAG: hypothetical protein A2086_13845 [Spirochaetes bacterium GWD1_27_9]